MAQRPLRTALAVSGAAVAVAAVVILHAVSSAARDAVIAEITEPARQRFNIYAGERLSSGLGRKVPLTEFDVRALERALPEAVVVPTLVFRATYRAGPYRGVWNVTGLPAWGFDAAGIRVVAGEPFSTLHESRGDAVVALGEDLARRVFGSPQAALGSRIYLADRPFRVLGITREVTDLFGAVELNTQVYVPMTLARRLAQDREYNWLTVYVPAPAQKEEVAHRAIRTLQSLHPGARYEWESPEGDVQAIQRIFGLLTRVLMISTGVALVAGGAGVTNVMLMAVTERTREIGICRAIGARRMDIMNQFLIEACMVCVLGGLAGITLAFAVTAALSQWWLGIRVHPGAVAVGLGFGISCCMGLLCGCFPAWRAATLQPVEALRHET